MSKKVLAALVAAVVLALAVWLVPTALGQRQRLGLVGPGHDDRGQHGALTGALTRRLHAHLDDRSAVAGSGRPRATTAAR